MSSVGSVTSIRGVKKIMLVRARSDDESTQQQSQKKTHPENPEEQSKIPAAEHVDEMV